MNRLRFVFLLLGLASLGCSHAANGPAPVIVNAPTVAPSTAPTPRSAELRDASTDEFAFIAPTADGPVVVLEQTLQDAWMAGPPELVTAPDAGMLELHRKLAFDRVPATAKRWQGRKVALYARDKIVCTATVGGLEIVALGMQPGFDWSGKPNSGPPSDKETVARDAWNLSAGYLVARLTEGWSVSCAKATWARDASLPPPSFVALEPADAEHRTRALEAFRALPAWRENQETYSEDQARRRAAGYGGTGPERWDHHVTVEVVRPRDRTAARLVVRASVGEMCDYSASLMAIFSGTAERLELIHSGPVIDFDQVLDANGDGRLETIGVSGRDDATLFSWKSDGSLEPLRALHILDAGCPC